MAFDPGQRYTANFIYKNKMNGIFLSASRFFLPRHSTNRAHSFGRVFALSLMLVWVTNGLLPCCELFSSRAADFHSNYAVAENHHETHEPDSNLPPHCQQLQDLTAVVVDGAHGTNINKPAAIGAALSQPTTIFVARHRPAISLAVFHPPPPSPYFLRTSRLLI
jgi:hypothetical protein